MWGRGLATEGARAVLAHGFSSPGLDEVVSIYQPENAASGRVMVRLGMRFDRDTRHPTRGVAVRVLPAVTGRQWESQDHEGLGRPAPPQRKWRSISLA